MSINSESVKLAAILLAAGPSSRLGQSKQLVRVDGESLVRKTTRLLQAMDLASITVVTGCESEAVESEVKDLPVTIVYNPNWARGMGSSIAAGARKAPAGADGVLLMVCDQWRLEHDDLSLLISSWNADISQVYMACWKEGKAFVSGPPVLFPRHLIQELKFVQESRGARQIIDRFMDIVEFVTMDNAAHDLDRPEDLKQLLKL